MRHRATVRLCGTAVRAGARPSGLTRYAKLCSNDPGRKAWFHKRCGNGRLIPLTGIYSEAFRIWSRQSSPMSFGRNAEACQSSQIQIGEKRNDEKANRRKFSVCFLCAVAFVRRCGMVKLKKIQRKRGYPWKSNVSFKMGMLGKEFSGQGALRRTKIIRIRKPPARCRALSIKPSMRQRESCT